MNELFAQIAASKCINKDLIARYASQHNRNIDELIKQIVQYMFVALKNIPPHFKNQFEVTLLDYYKYWKIDSNLLSSYFETNIMLVDEDGPVSYFQKHLPSKDEIQLGDIPVADIEGSPASDFQGEQQTDDRKLIDIINQFQKLAIDSAPYYRYGPIARSNGVPIEGSRFFFQRDSAAKKKEKMITTLYSTLNTSDLPFQLDQHYITFVGLANKELMFVKNENGAISFNCQTLLLWYQEYVPSEKKRVELLLHFAPFYFCTTSDRSNPPKEWELKTYETPITFQQFVLDLSFKAMGDILGHPLSKETRAFLSEHFTNNDTLRRKTLYFLTHLNWPSQKDRGFPLPKPQGSEKILVACWVMINFLNHYVLPEGRTEKHEPTLFFWILNHSLKDIGVLSQPPSRVAEDDIEGYHIDISHCIPLITRMTSQYGLKKANIKPLPSIAFGLLLEMRHIPTEDQRSFIEWIAQCCEYPHAHISNPIDLLKKERFNKKRSTLDTFIKKLPQNLKGKSLIFFDIVNIPNLENQFEMVEQLNQALEVNSARQIDSDIYFLILYHFITGTFDSQYFNVFKVHAWERDREEWLHIWFRVMLAPRKPDLPKDFYNSLNDVLPKQLSKPTERYFFLHRYREQLADLQLVRQLNDALEVDDANAIDATLYFYALITLARGTLAGEEFDLAMSCVTHYSWEQGREEILKLIFALPTEGRYKILQQAKQLLELSRPTLTAPIAALFSLDDPNYDENHLKAYNKLFDFDHETAIPTKLYLDGLTLFTSKQIGEEHFGLLELYEYKCSPLEALELMVAARSSVELREKFPLPKALSKESNQKAQYLFDQLSHLHAPDAKRAIQLFEEHFNQKKAIANQVIQSHLLHQLSPLPQTIRDSYLKCIVSFIQELTLSQEEQLYLFQELLAIQPLTQKYDDNSFYVIRRLLRFIEHFAGLSISSSDWCQILTYHPKFDSPTLEACLRAIEDFRLELIESKIINQPLISSSFYEKGATAVNNLRNLITDTHASHT